jgi:hypothetical protein
MKGRWITYSAGEMAWLEANRLMVISDYHRAFCAAFGRQDVAVTHLHALRKRKGWKTGRTGCFAKGEVPHNKGKPHPARGRSAETQFKKGARTGKAALNYKPVGYERICEDGYLERKIHDDLPFKSRWRLVHVLNWEAANGPIPDGHCLKCLDGDKLNTDPSNWELIPRALLPRLAGGNRHRRTLAYDDAAPEVRPTILAIARLEHRVRKLGPAQARA